MAVLTDTVSDVFHKRQFYLIVLKIKHSLLISWSSTMNWVYLWLVYIFIHFLHSSQTIHVFLTSSWHSTSPSHFILNLFQLLISNCGCMCFQRLSVKKQWKRTAVITHHGDHWHPSEHGTGKLGPHYVSVTFVTCQGKEVLQDCRSLTNASLLLMGVIYAVNLSYPLKLKYSIYLRRLRVWHAQNVFIIPESPQETPSVAVFGILVLMSCKWKVYVCTARQWSTPPKSVG